jgi:hypothetical protein
MSSTQKLILLLGLLWISHPSLAQRASLILGQWKNMEEPDRQMEFILGNDGKYQAHIIHDTDDASHHGKVVLKDLQYDAKTKSFKGLMSPPDADMELTATVFFEGPDKLKIVAKKFIMTKTIHLEKLK